jgi:hypothetical protein
MAPVLLVHPVDRPELCKYTLIRIQSDLCKYMRRELFPILNLNLNEKRERAREKGREFEFCRKRIKLLKCEQELFFSLRKPRSGLATNLFSRKKRKLGNVERTFSEEGAK